MDAERPGVDTSTIGSSTSPTSSNLSSLAGTSSSRPHSGCSSATSHSDNSDAEIEFSRFQHGVPPASCSTSSTVLPSTPPKIASPGNRTIPRSTPQQPCRTPSETSVRAREPARRAVVQTSSHWLSKNTIGIISLAASLSSLIFLGVRTYKLAVSQTINTALSTCINLIQANLTNLETSSTECKKSIAQGVTDSPYHLGKRILRHASTFVVRVKRAELHALSNSFHQASRISRISWLLIPAFATIVLGAILLTSACRSSRDRESVQSAARSDVLVTRVKGKETETIAEQGVRVVKHNADHDHYPGHLRRRLQPLREEDDKGANEIAAWQTINSSISSSSETLVNPLTGSDPERVSIMDHSANETHEGLIELKTTGDNKTYFDPETGEFIHLTPWKSPHKDGDESKDNHSDKAATKKDTARAIARMATGLGAYAGGKIVDDALAREITDAENRRIAQRAGDCLAGLVTNEHPSGWPQTV